MVTIGSTYTFAPGGHAAYEAWYKMRTHKNQINALDESDVLEVVRFSDAKETEYFRQEQVQFKAADGFIVNVWMPVRYVDKWLVPATAAAGEG